MAQVEVNITDTPINLKDAPTSLAEGNLYEIQCLGNAAVRFWSGAAAPANRDSGQVLNPYDWRSPYELGADPLWVWKSPTSDGTVAKLSISWNT